MDATNNLSACRPCPNEVLRDSSDQNKASKQQQMPNVATACKKR